MANKVRYGLKNLYRAKLDRTGKVPKYGPLKRMIGAVSMTATPQGSDPKDFYADDGVLYTKPGTNGGYDVEFVVGHLTDEDRQDLLGEIEYDGVYYETTDAHVDEYAYIMEMQGDFKPIAFCFFAGKASRVATNANTDSDSSDVDTDTLSVRFTGLEFDIDGEAQPIVQGHLEKTDENAEKFKKFFETVPVPGFAKEDEEGGNPEEDEGEPETQALDAEDGEDEGEQPYSYI